MGSSGKLEQIVIDKKEVADFKERLASFEKIIRNKRSVMKYVFSTRKHEFFNAWAETYEQAIKKQILDLGVDNIRGIAQHLRHKLKDANLERAIPYMYEVLPAKYKEHRPNQDEGGESEILLQNSSSSNQSFEDENALWIILLEQWKQGINLVINKMRTGPWSSLLDRAEEQQSVIVQFAAVQMLHEIMDDRQGVPTNTQHLLLAACLLLNTNDAGAYYFKDVKGKLDLTRKQTTKIVEGLIQSGMDTDRERPRWFDFTKVKDIKGKLHYMFEPTNAEKARRMGFSGRQCPECDCWRTSRRYHSAHEDWLYCCGCQHWWEYESDDLYLNPKAKEVDQIVGRDGSLKIVTRQSNSAQPK